MIRFVYIALLCVAACAPVSAMPSRLDAALAGLKGELMCVETRDLERTPAMVEFYVDKSQPPCLVYDPEFMAAIERDYGYPAVVGIFAHELGHVIGLDRGDLSQEFADFWAGCALARRGLSLRPYLRVLEDLTQNADRAASTRTGALSCNGQHR